MIQLLIYAGIAVVALGAIYGVDRSRQAVGERRIEAKYAPITEQCKALQNEKPADCAAAMRDAVKGRDTAVAANKSLDEQFTTFRAMHNKAIEDANAEYESLKARKAQRATEIAPKLADIRMQQFDYIVATKGGGLSCPQLDIELEKLAPQRFRDYGPATEPSTPPGAVRVVPPAPSPTRPVNPLRPKP